MSSLEHGPFLHCEDCDGRAPLDEHPDAPELLRRVKEFLAEHSRCSFTVSITLPSQREVRLDAVSDYLRGERHRP